MLKFCCCRALTDFSKHLTNVLVDSVVGNECVNGEDRSIINTKCAGLVAKVDMEEKVKSVFHQVRQRMKSDEVASEGDALSLTLSSHEVDLEVSLSSGGMSVRYLKLSFSQYNVRGVVGGLEHGLKNDVLNALSAKGDVHGESEQQRLDKLCTDLHAMDPAKLRQAVGRLGDLLKSQTMANDYFTKLLEIREASATFAESSPSEGGSGDESV